MLRTLFYIPNKEIAGLPVFGCGWSLFAWAVYCIASWIGLIREQGLKGETWGCLPILASVGAALWFLLPGLCEPIPGRSGLEGLPIHSYGVMLLIAITSAVGMAIYRGRRMGIRSEPISTLALWALVPGIIGARVFYVIEYWDDFQRETLGDTLVAVVNVAQGGLVVYGSMIGGAVGLIAFFYKYKMPSLATLDLIAPSLMLGIAIGRIGCFLNGCCFGGISDLPWAITFPSSPTASPAYVYQVQHGDTFLQGLIIAGNPGNEPVIREVQASSAAEKRGLEPGQRVVSINGHAIRSIYQAQRQLMYAQRSEREIVIQTDGSRSAVRWPVTGPPPRSEPVHPTQLYSSLNGLVLCLLLLAFARFRRHDGEVFAMLLTLYPITRFILEILRTDEPGVFGTGLTISQMVSLILLLCAVALWAYVLVKLPGKALARYQESNTTNREAPSFGCNDTLLEATSSSPRRKSKDGHSGKLSQTQRRRSR